VTDRSAEEAKLLNLARAARARVGAAEGAAVRDADGRTYAAASVDLPSLSLSALEAAVAAAVSSGATGFDAAAVVTSRVDGDPPGLAAVRDLGGPGTLLFVAGPDGVVRRTLRMSPS
jgi:cytidine deaminase